MSKAKDNNLLDYIPSRKSDLGWSQDAEGIVTLHRKNTGFYNRLAQRVFRRPAVSHIHLERYGSFLWLQMDGSRNVRAIAELMKARFSEDIEPLYPRIGQYLRILKNNGFIQMKKN